MLDKYHSKLKGLNEHQQGFLAALSSVLDSPVNGIKPTPPHPTAHEHLLPTQSKNLISKHTPAALG
jgi:hypothetical protein